AAFAGWARWLPSLHRALPRCGPCVQGIAHQKRNLFSCSFSAFVSLGLVSTYLRKLAETVISGKLAKVFDSGQAFLRPQQFPGILPHPCQELPFPV
ncbi:MAG: hypothetical protein WB542_06100, partial [Polaromonas sp.]